MLAISAFDRLMSHTATCCTLPFPNSATALRCMRNVRLIKLPVLNVPPAVPTLTPSTNTSNTVSMRLNITACQVLSKAVPARITTSGVMPLPLALALTADGTPLLSFPTWTLLFSLMLLPIHNTELQLKSVPPLTRKNSVKFTPSKLGSTDSVLDANPAMPSVLKHVPCSPASPSQKLVLIVPVIARSFPLPDESASVVPLSSSHFQ